MQLPQGKEVLCGDPVDFDAFRLKASGDPHWALVQVMAKMSSARIMISLSYLILFITLMGQYLVESQFINVPERVLLEKLAKIRDLHLKMTLKDEQEDVLKPSCTSTVKKLITKHLPTSYRTPEHLRLKRQLTNNNSPRNPSPYGTAAYFSGNSESLRYKGSTPLPNHQFSVGVWIKPEGGQNVPVHFLGKFYAVYL